MFIVDLVHVVKRNKYFVHVQIARIQVTLRMRKVSSGPLFSIHTFCNIQWYC